MKEQIVKYLRDLGNYIIDPEERDYGICFNLSQEFPDVGNLYSLVAFAAESWEHRSGDPVFPVPTSVFSYDYWSFESEEGRLRRDLCLHVADWIEENCYEINGKIRTR